MFKVRAKSSKPLEMAFTANSAAFVAFVLLCSAPTRLASSDRDRYGLPKGVNGGVGCLVCTVVVALAEQLSIVHKETFVEAYVRLCDILPNPYRNACDALGKFYVPRIIDLITDEVTPDVICHVIHLCYEDKGQPYCHAFPPKSDFRERVSKSRKQLSSKLFNENETFYGSKGPGTFDPCTLEGVKDLCKLYDRVFHHDLPLEDLDNDTYSIFEAWRGSSWRGKDCDDINALSHPGVKPSGSDVITDSNCNGIYGIDPIARKPYEDLFCKGWYSNHFPFVAWCLLILQIKVLLFNIPYLVTIECFHSATITFKKFFTFTTLCSLITKHVT